MDLRLLLRSQFPLPLVNIPRADSVESFYSDHGENLLLQPGADNQFVLWNDDDHVFELFCELRKFLYLLAFTISLLDSSDNPSQEPSNHLLNLDRDLGCFSYPRLYIRWLSLRWSNNGSARSATLHFPHEANVSRSRWSFQVHRRWILF